MKSSKLVRFFILFDLTILVLLIPFLLLNKEKVVLNESIRALSGRDFVELSNGFVHYELDGPAEGELVVLVHGFSVPSYIWEPTLEGLIAELLINFS
jgi:hypothetical protein